VSLSHTLAAGKAGSFQFYPVKTSGKGGQREKKKSRRYSRKKKCIITLSASHW